MLDWVGWGWVGFCLIFHWLGLVIVSMDWIGLGLWILDWVGWRNRAEIAYGQQQEQQEEHNVRIAWGPVSYPPVSISPFVIIHSSNGDLGIIYCLGGSLCMMRWWLTTVISTTKTSVVTPCRGMGITAEIFIADALSTITSQLTSWTFALFCVIYVNHIHINHGHNCI